MGRSLHRHRCRPKIKPIVVSSGSMSSQADQKNTAGFKKKRPSVLAVIRFKEWSNSKIPFFLACMYYAALSRPQPGLAIVGEMAGLLLLICLYASFGYVINSLSDRKVDLIAGKPNSLAEMSNAGALTIVWAVIAASVLTALILYAGRPALILLIALSYVTAAIYSLPPIRLKEHGVLGLLASSVAQRTLPVVIVFVTMQLWDAIAIGLCTLSTLIGLRFIIIHQLIDERNDLAAGVRTVATAGGVSGLEKALKFYVLPLELLNLGIVLILMSITIPALGVVSVLYICWFAAQTVVFKNDERLSVNSYYLFSEFYFFYWPMTLATVLFLDDEHLWMIFVFSLLWLSRWIWRELRFANRAIAALF